MSRLTRVVGQLLIFNVLAYVLTAQNPVLFNEFALVPALIVQRPWTLLTYQFLHGSFGHIFFNMLGLFFFGPRLEVRLGSRHFLGLYLVSGLMGAVVHILYTMLPVSGGGMLTPMIGASAAVYGVLLGYARFWPRDKILIWFVIPVEIRMAVIGLTVISLWSGLGPAHGNIAHFAHLGGFLGGWLYLKGKDRWSPARQFQRKVESPGVGMGDRQLQACWARIDPSGLHEVNRVEYDRIAERVRAAGWAALTPRERTFVERFGGRNP